MLYAVKRVEDGMYLAAPATGQSYATALEKARVFTSREAAERFGLCGNEVIVPLSEILYVHY